MAPFAHSRRARVEYGKGLAPAPRVGIARLSTDDGLAMWWVEGDGSPSATASVTSIPGDLY